MRNLILACLAAVFVAAASAQTATAKLYSKGEPGRVLVAIQVVPEPGAWLYHDEADSGGKPTVVTLSPAEWAWSKAQFPEPKRKADPIVGQAKVHTKEFVIYAVATGEGLDPDLVTVALEGLACNERLCLPWSVASLETRGPGTDKVWKDFPAALLTAPAAQAPSQGAAVPSAGEAVPSEWKPEFDNRTKIVGRAFARQEGDTIEVAVELAIAPEFHAYHGPTAKDVGPGVGQPTVPTIEGGNVEWGEWKLSKPKPYDHDTGLTYEHEGRLVLRVTGEAYDEFDPESVVVNIKGQVCDARGCIPFELTPTVELATSGVMVFGLDISTYLGHGQGAGAAATTVTNTANVGGMSSGSSSSLLEFLLIAVGAGLITLLMPCTYPMIPITISFFTKQATARGGNVLSLALLYGLGIVLMFVFIGVLVGPVIVEYAQGWVMNFAIGVLFVVFALALFGLFTLQPPAFLMNAAGKASQQGGYIGVFMMGACLVITSFTCTAPFVGSLLGAGAGSSMSRIILGMGVFGLTMATPFVALALLPGRLQRIPQAGGWMETLKIFMGFVELAAALKFFSNADIVLSGGNFENGGWISREMFLALWVVISVVAALYLFGRINLKGENPDGHIGAGRLLGGIAMLIFGATCSLGVIGYQLGGTMSALAPPTSYTSGLVPIWGGEEIRHVVVKDDYDQATAQAVAGGKILLANFTGHT